ncbi:MAG: hypothetical protein ACP5EP_11625 [Acidobacteriaceae bacterium]
MKRAYRTICKQGKINEQELTSFLVKNGQGLLPMVDLIEQCQVACDQLIDMTGRATIQAVLQLSAMEAAGGPQQQGRRRSGDVVFYGSQAGKVFLSDRKLEVARPRLRTKGPRSQEVEVPAYAAMQNPAPMGARMLAIQLGASFVGRSFSGDKKQLLTMLKAAIAHQGTVMLDVISPCVTFNDHEGSTKSYKYLQAHDDVIAEADFVPGFDEITADYDAGKAYDVKLHDGSRLTLRKLHEEYDPTDRVSAIKALMEASERGEVLTGVLYIDPKKPTFTDLLNMVPEPLATLPESMTRPPKKVLEEVMESLR